MLDPAGLRSVTFGAKGYVAVGSKGTILTSSDGIEWTERDSGVRNVIGNTLYGVAYGPKGYVAVGDSGIILTSDNGTDWKLITSASQNIFIAVTYCFDKYFSVGIPETAGPSGKTKINMVFVSTDGKTWAGEGVKDAGAFLAVSCGSGRTVVAVGKGIAQSAPLPFYPLYK